MTDPRRTWAWRKLAAQVVAEEPTCWLQLDGCTRLSTTGDHIYSVATHPHLALTRSNIRGACASCNRVRGAYPVGATHQPDGSQGQHPGALRFFESST